MKPRTVSAVRHVHTRRAGKRLGNVHRLRQESLDAAGAGHSHLIVFRKLFDAQDRNNVLKVLVALQNSLYISRYVIVILAHDARVQNA